MNTLPRSPTESISGPEEIRGLFAYRFCGFILRLANIAVLLGAASIPVSYDGLTAWALFSACVTLAALYEALRRYALPRVSTTGQLNAVAAAILIPGAALNMAALWASGDVAATGGTIGLMIAGSLAFHSTGMFVLMMAATLGSWLAAATMIGPPPLSYLTHLGLVAPALALSLRWAARRTYDELSALRERERALVTTLEANVTRLREEVANRERADRMLYEAQRMESLGLLAGGVAHDFNNFLLAIIAFSESILRGEEPSPHQDAVEQIKQTALSAASICQQMLTYSGEPTDGRAPADLPSLVNEMRPLIEASLPKNVEPQFLVEGEASVLIDHGQIRQAIMNVVLNAAEAMQPDGGEIRIATLAFESVDDDPADVRSYRFGHPDEADLYHCIRVQDSGSGIRPEILPRIFDPYFTTKESGHGLGLAVTLGILTSHGGCVLVRLDPGSGTTVELIVPEASLDTVVTKPMDALSDTSGVTGSVLVVDDEPMVREAVSAMLRAMGCDVLSADGGPTALEKLSSREGDVEVVVLDYSMPEMNGLEVLREIRRAYPTTRVVLSSGYMMEADDGDEAVVAADAYLDKPYTMSKLRDVLFEVTSGGTRHTKVRPTARRT